MPNDIPDWTGQQRVNLRGDVSGLPLGDTGAAVQSADSETDQITTTAAINQAAQVLASLKPAAGSVVAIVGNPGALATGSSSSVSPAFSQATTAGNLLVATVESPYLASSPIASASAGWVQVVDNSVNGGSAIWKRENCGAAEAAPTFTCGPGGTTLMHAQLFEFSGAATSGSTDRTAVANPAGTPSTTASASAADVSNGDLMVMAVAWLLALAAKATFSDVFNNGATAVQAGNTGGSPLRQHANFAYAIIPAPTLVLPLGTAPWPYDAFGTSAPGGGVQASVVLPATPGKRYIAAYLSASTLDNTGAANNSLLQLLDGATVIATWRMDTPLVVGQTSKHSEVGVAIPGTLGNSMTLRFSAGVANVFQTVNFGAYLR